MSNKKSEPLAEIQRQLLDAIKSAFSDVPYPGDDKITKVHYAVCGSECFECARVREAFQGKNWSDFLEQPYELLGYFPPRKPVSDIGRSFLPLLEVEAFVFFLPVFLAAMIIDRGEADVMQDSILSDFDPGPKAKLANDPAQWEYCYQRCKRIVAAMSTAQRNATSNALRFIFTDSYKSHVRPTSDDAIRNLEAGEVLAWAETNNEDA